MRLSKTVTLNNGIEMPRVGLGVMFLEDMQSAVDAAIDSGYRLFDNAALYGNEADIGQAVKNNGISREDVFLSTKLRNRAHRYNDALKEFELSRKALGVDYIDLYLIHWPCPEQDLYCEAWRALEHLYKEGYVRCIGLSNFHETHIRKILDMCEIKPVVNQLECNPYLTIESLRKFCHEHGIWPEAWFPLGGPPVPKKGEPPKKLLLKEPLLHELGQRYGKSAAQIALRWELQSDIIIIPKSSNPSRIHENIDIFDFELTAEEMAAVGALNCDRRVGPDPDTLNELF